MSTREIRRLFLHHIPLIFDQQSKQQNKPLFQLPARENENEIWRQLILNIVLCTHDRYEAIP